MALGGARPRVLDINRRGRVMKRNKTKSVPPMVGMPGGRRWSPTDESPPLSRADGRPSEAPMMPRRLLLPPWHGTRTTAGEPQWDARVMPTSVDGVTHGVQYDQTAGAWKPIE